MWARRSTASRSIGRSGCAPMSSEPDLGRIRPGAIAAVTTDTPAAKDLSRPGRLHLAGRGIHAQDGRDARAAHRSRLSPARHRGRSRRGAAAGHAGDRDLSRRGAGTEHGAPHYFRGRRQALRRGDRASTASAPRSAPAASPGSSGRTGPGKSTLLRLIDGLLVPSSGRITVCGLDSAAQAPAVHAITGYMPQRFGLYEDLTVRENLDLYADLRGVTGAAAPDAFRTPARLHRSRTVSRRGSPAGFRAA